MARQQKRSEAGAALADSLMGREARASELLVIPPPEETGTRVPVVPVPDGRPKNEPPPLFTTAHKGEGIHPDVQRIIETIYAPDIFQQYGDLEQNLEVGDDRGDYRTLTVHLDKAEARARRAHKLYLGAKLELAGWELDARKVTSAMRGEALAELEAEKEAGERRKAITNDDVESRIAEKFPDEWKAQQLTHVRLKGVVDDMEHMTRAWNNKCGDLRTLLETLRK